MAHVDTPKEANTVKKMNDRCLLLSSNGVIHYLRMGDCKWFFKKDLLSFNASDLTVAISYC